MKIGIYGGTFNPIHLGHLHAAKEIRESSQLDKVILILAADPPHKKSLGIAPFQSRYSWVEKTIRGHDNLEVSPIEEERSLSYTVDTLRELKKDNGAHDLFLIMGNDMSLTFSTWKDWSEVLKLATPIVALRKGFDQNYVDLRLPEAVRDLFKNSVITIETIDLSSTKIRELVKSKKSIENLVAQEVVDEVSSCFK